MCRGVRNEGYRRCFRCQTHHDQAGGTLADIVVPISYSPRSGQHHHNLRIYKGAAPAEQARWSLLAILLLFLRDHLSCVSTRVGARPTHLTAVPSTRGRAGAHPLAVFIGSRIGLPWITSSVDARYGADDREFHADWFRPAMPPVDGPVHVLLVDDTWTTGARAQSLAHALKCGGAATVSTVVLGRHVDPDFQPSKRLLTAIADQIFDPTRCAAEDDFLGGL